MILEQSLPSPQSALKHEKAANCKLSRPRELNCSVLKLALGASTENGAEHEEVFASAMLLKMRGLF